MNNSFKITIVYRKQMLFSRIVTECLPHCFSGQFLGLKKRQLANYIGFQICDSLGVIYL